MTREQYKFYGTYRRQAIETLNHVERLSKKFMLTDAELSELNCYKTALEYVHFPRLYGRQPKSLNELRIFADMLER